MATTELDHPANTYEADVRDEHFALRHVRFLDPVITGRELIENLGYHPAEDYIVLRYRPDSALEEVGLEACVSLAEPREHSFFVNRASEMENLVIDGVRLTWTQTKVTGATLKCLARKEPHSVDLFRECNDAAPEFIGDEDEVHLDKPGVEHFITKPAVEVDIAVNEKRVPILRGWHSGAEIKAAAIKAGVNIQPSFTLSEDKPGGKIIGDKDPVYIKGGECFLAVDDHDDS